MTMKKLIISLLLTSSLAYANICDRNILQQNPDSQHITINAGKVYSNDSEMMDEKMALNSANFMNSKYSCDHILTNKNSLVSCSAELMKSKNICYIKVKYGYYIVYKDYVDTVHITFSRWD